MDIYRDNVARNPKPFYPLSKKVISSCDITALYEDKKGFIWAGAKYHSAEEFANYVGLYKLNHEGEVLARHAIKKWPAGNQRLMNQLINQIYMASAGTIWLATGFGLVMFNEDQEKTTIFRYPGNDTLSVEGYRMLTLCPDPNNPEKYLWLGTAGGGLLCFDKDDKTFIPVNLNDELPGRHIASMLADEDGHIWIATDRGIVRATSAGNGGELTQVSLYDRSCGLITDDYSNFYGHNAVKTKNGALIFTGPKGFQIIDPENISLNTYIPPVYISNLSINYEAAWHDQPGSPLDEPLSLATKIRLPHNKNTLSFELTAPNYQSTGHLEYV
nr:hypothetical protein [Bacteroidota bacterium]